MSYIGRGIDQIDNISTLDNLSFNGSDATFNLTQNSVAFVPVSADALQIQIDGVIQSGNYTVSGSTVTFDFTPSGSSVCNGIKHFGVGVLTRPSDNSVGITQLNVSDGTNGQALTTNGSGTLAFASVGVDGVTTGSGNVTITNGNLVLGTSGKGIDFSATSGTGTSEILDDYEEGTWTASVVVDSGSMTLESAFNTGSYVKIGNIVNVQGFFKVDSTSAGLGYIGISGLPFTSASLSEGADSSVGACFVRNASSTIGGGVICWIESNGQTLTALRENGTTGVGNTLTSHFDSGTDFTLNVTYRTT